jgi:hypothetical protein
MIPTDEMERLLVAAVTASALARSGQIQLGYDWLQAGYLHALDHRAEGMACAETLVERWLQVIDSYCAEFELPIAGRGLQPTPVCSGLL